MAVAAAEVTHAAAAAAAAADGVVAQTASDLRPLGAIFQPYLPPALLLLVVPSLVVQVCVGLDAATAEL